MILSLKNNNNTNSTFVSINKIVSYFATIFVKLLNGKDLSGWKTNGNWVVQKDGSLMIDPLPEQKGWKRIDDYLISEKTYANFSWWK